MQIPFDYRFNVLLAGTTPCILQVRFVASVQKLSLYRYFQLAKCLLRVVWAPLPPPPTNQNHVRLFSALG